MLRSLFGRSKPKPPARPPALPLPPQPVAVTDADFAQVVEASNLPVVVDFWAEWCEPCHIMSAYAGFLAADFAGRVLVTALDVDENPVAAERYQIMGLPTLLILRQGAEVARITGIIAYAEIQRQVEQLLVDG